MISEIVRCTGCGYTKINTPTNTKGQPISTLLGSEFTCTKCGWHNLLGKSPYYGWLFLF